MTRPPCRHEAWEESLPASDGLVSRRCAEPSCRAYLGGNFLPDRRKQAVWPSEPTAKAEPIRASRPNTMVAIDNDVLEAIRRYARPGDTDGDIIARMVWAATSPGGTVAEPISPGR